MAIMVTAMTKIRPMNRCFLLTSRRYIVAVAAENVRVAAELKPEVKASEKVESVCWMRDPKTGYWVPETHYGNSTCVAELREKLLSKKHKLS